MLSEEEKKAIDIVENIKFKTYCVYIAEEMRDEIRFYQTEEERKAIDIVLNLIKKWQEENNRLKEYIKENEIYKDNLFKTYEEQQKEIEKLHKEINQRIKLKLEKERGANRDFISKNKIREKLNYFENSFDYDDNGESYELVMEVLDELLEEN